MTSETQISARQIPGTQTEASARGSRTAIAVLIVSTFTVILNEMLMAVALPRIMTDLEISATTAQWLTTGYMLTMAVVIPITGFLTERFRMRTVFTLAMGIFVAGTLVAVAAPGYHVLLIGRVIQAVGTAIVTPLVYTGVNTLVPPTRRGSTMALVTIAVSAAPALGPVVSGLILSVASWRWLFVLILPIGLLCLVVGNALIRVPSVPRKVQLDRLSVVWSVIGFASLVYGLASLGEGAGGHTPVSPWTAMLVGILGIGLFVARQLKLQRADRAQLDMRPFSVRTFSVAALLMVLFITPASGVMALVPVIVQTSFGLDTVHAGLFMLPAGLMITAISMVVGRFYGRVGPRTLILVGALLDASGLWFLSTLGAETSIWLTLAAFVYVVAGQAFMWTPVFTVSLGALEGHLLPHGSAIVNTITQLTGAAGIALAFSMVSAASEGAGTHAPAAMAEGARHVYLVGSVPVAAILVVALFLPKRAAPASVAVAIH